MDPDYGEIYSALQVVTQNARTYFAQCGNSIVQPKDEDAFAAEVLYMYFNRRSCVDDPLSKPAQPGSGGCHGRQEAGGGD